VDQHGRTHYSDTPVDGATKIELKDSQTFTNPVAAPRTSSQAAPAAEPESASAAPAAPAYTTFDIVSPANGDTLWNTGGTLTVQLAIYPTLDPSHRIDAIVDGDYVEVGAKTLTVTVPEVYRGEHTLQAVVVDADGTQLKRTSRITLTVQQTSIQNPNNPNSRPRPNPVVPRN
jgi:hypothetical protein